MSKVYYILFFFGLLNYQIGEKYAYKSERFYECLELNANNRFIYQVRDEFMKYTIEGNYILIRDSIILNSSPQREKMIVVESKTKHINKLTFSVTDKLGAKINYHLSLILNNGQVVNYKNQWNFTTISKMNIKGFYITDSKGIVSTVYNINGKFTNYFRIQFETKRVFDSESWYIDTKQNKIVPRKPDGNFCSYSLSMEEI
ncbi:MAG: hypothetical protein KA229_01600 [Chitinophagaceae bacterium]|nr:hypothetical protein [Chitinophagaceae bacterium]MBP6588767.1 hypothetical protein [Chitinophagaceae bacterium]